MIEFIAPPKYANALRGTAHGLSLSRIFLGLLVYFLVANDVAPWIPLLIFVIAGLTDWADGVVARMSNEPSKFGAVLDPICDKALFLIVLAAIWNQVWVLAATTLVMIEIAYLILPAVLYSKMDNEDAKANGWGKTKMVCECLALGMFILHWESVGNILIGVALIAAIIGGVTKVFQVMSAQDRRI